MRRFFLVLAILLASPATPGLADTKADCLQNQNPDLAVAACDEMIRRHPKDSGNYMNRALAYEGKKDLDRANADYTRAIALNPLNAGALINRANNYRRQNNYDKALSEYDAIIALDKRQGNLSTIGKFILYHNRGLTWHMKADYTEAISNYNLALGFDRKAVTYVLRGQAYFRRDNLEAAIRDYQEALRLDPNNSDARASLARAEAAKFATVQPSVVARPSLLTRKAIIIGNSDYIAGPLLNNPVRDANAIAATLRSVGFQTVKVELNLSRQQLIQALRAFQDEADQADWAVIYYAGHGIEIANTNYLVPIDAKLKADRDIQDEAVSLDRVMAALSGAKKLRLVILDACRDNPFIAQMRRTGLSRSIGRGLAAVEPEGGTLVAYAAKAGQIAFDGEAANSPFVTALTQRLQTPNLEISKLFRLVRDDVLAATGKRQEPFVYGSLPAEDFFFLQK